MTSLLQSPAERLLPVFLRLSLASAFFSAVADRFGWWGPPGAPGVAWGSIPRFMEYAARINPEAPAALVPALGWTATGLEILCGAALLLGFKTRVAAGTGGILLLLFALGMAFGTGIKSPLDASVFTASAASFALAVLGPGRWSIDSPTRRPGSLTPPGARPSGRPDWPAGPG
jgi:uncharacterized membrane protein YphA (DoxX/SURF4 family)